MARSLTGPALQEIAFPLGGIGTGTVSLGGRGQLRDWEPFNRPARGRDLPFTFFTLWCRPAPASGQPRPAVARVLERQLPPPFVDCHVLAPGFVGGLPRLGEATFTGTYPIAELRFRDDALPLEVELEAFHPFRPFDACLSGLPVAIFLWRLRNPHQHPVSATQLLRARCLK
jgi:non-lysosomal glucosylceramidase